MEILKGTLAELGEAITTTGNTSGMTHYSYIEMADGKMVKRVGCLLGLNGKLKQALAENQAVELHINEAPHLGDMANFILGIKIGDRLYASTFPAAELNQVKNLIRFLNFAGVCTIPLFGIGFLLLWFGMKFKSKIQPLLKMDSYVRQLPNAILI